MSITGGRHLLQIPGPTNVPDRVLRAIDRPTIDHRGPEFAALGKEVLAGLRTVFATSGPVIVYPASGTGAWEAALVNTLSPGDRVLICETGHFSSLWQAMAARLGFDVELLSGDWRHGVDAVRIEERLHADTEHRVRAVCVVHNETSTGVCSNVPAVRAAIDRARHPALLFVDTISSLGSIDYRHEAWGVDVTVGGSQKGLMLPPGLSFNAVSPKALDAQRSAKSARSYWDWEPMLQANQDGYFPYTPSTNLLFGLREALRMLADETLPRVFARHARHAAAARAAVRAWGLELNPLDDREHSNSLTAVRMPDGFDEGRLRSVILEKFDMSLGQGLGKVKGKLFRIGHLGHFNDLMLCATLSGVELGLQLAGVPSRPGGVQAALDELARQAGESSS